MSDFTLNHSRLSGIQGQVRSVGNAVSNTSGRLTSQANALAWQQGFAIQDIRRVILECSREAARVRDDVHRINNFLGQLGDIVFEHENRAIVELEGEPHIRPMGMMGAAAGALAGLHHVVIVGPGAHTPRRLPNVRWLADLADFISAILVDFPNRPDWTGKAAKITGPILAVWSNFINAHDAYRAGEVSLPRAAAIFSRGLTIDMTGAFYVGKAVAVVVAAPKWIVAGIAWGVWHVISRPPSRVSDSRLINSFREHFQDFGSAATASANVAVSTGRAAGNAAKIAGGPVLVLWVK